ncbi:MAG: hypothetical protein ACOCSR_05530, partial [Wenzhouxiangella sp.]
MNPRHPQTGSNPTGAELEHSLLDLARRTTSAGPGKGRAFEPKRLRARLERLYSGLEAAQTTGRAVSRAEEWLLDNRHVIEDALESLKQDMPPGYVRSLPHVPTGDRGWVPRVHELARILGERGGAPLDPERIERAVEQFQAHESLSIGELWALPSFLVLEIIRTLLADAQSVRPGMEARQPDRETSLADHIAGGIISLRALSNHDWRDSFERLSHVEHILGEDPAGAYAAMDFESRDRYRRVVERLAKRGNATETVVAGTCVDLCKDVDDTSSRHRHVGYWLIAGGRRRLERLTGFRPTWRESLLRLALHRPEMIYFLPLSAFIAVPMAVLT